MNIQLLTSGLLTTVQDAGRHGLRHLGVGCAGALDSYSLQVANLLVGNRADAAALEIALAGPRLRLEHAARIALCGADVEAHVGDLALPCWHRIDLPAQTELAIGHCRRGARAYLAIAGGIDVPRVLGSAATDLRGGFGGLDGRALHAGDRVALGAMAPVDTDRIRIAPWWIDPTPDLDFDLPALASVLPGSDATSPPDALFAQVWQVSSHSDRQGVRLEGPALQRIDSRERISEPVVPGTIQLPPDGKPIVLLADAQTHGGYPRIGHVVATDLPCLAQLRPGETVRFAPVTPAQANAAWRGRRQRLQRIALAISAKTST
jgi:antagonist of KipI